jgi:uncharacterized DUF497 family protein
MIRIAELEFDDYNEDKLSAHGVTAQEVVQLLENMFTVRLNKRSGIGERQLIGRTNGGRVLTVVLAPTAVADRWRPITGWDSTSSERRALDG